MTKPGTAKQALLLAIQHFIYKPAQKKLDDRKEILCKRHSLECPNSSTTFLYKGQMYWSTANLIAGKPSLLVRSLHDEMDKFIFDYNELATEISITKSFFTTLLLTANTEADVCALLPECIRSALVNPVVPSESYTEEFIADFHQQHSKSIQLIKERLVLNMST